MPTFKLDGKEIPFEPGDSIIKAAHRQGIEIPHYCWHPGLSAPANCRMCLVEIKPPPNQRPVMLDILELDRKTGEYKPVQKPKLQPACQYPAVENQEVLSDSSGHVKEARSHVQELLLLNHPVDCPICDQSGECKLQDYWLEHQKSQKRMRDEPIHKPKGVSFGDTIVYDGERCVMCTRCIRFMDEVAKDPVLDMRERGNLNEIFVAPGRKLEGNYTFMTEHVCPVGALTTKDFRFKARVWFLRTADSVCQGCATGCNAHLDYDPRNNKAYRYRPRDNEQVNKFWMCDEGMKSYTRAHEGRMTEARVNGKKAKLSSAMESAAAALKDAQPEISCAILSATHSQEDNGALLELAKTLGIETVYVAGKSAGKGDDILIDADKNSNTKGAAQLAATAKAKSWTSFAEDVAAGRVHHAIALGADVASDEDSLTKLETLIVISAYDGALTSAAKVALPATSWAEQAGYYVNRQGLAQESKKALEPHGAAKHGWQLVSELGRALGHELGIGKLREVRQKLGLSAPSPENATKLQATIDAKSTADHGVTG
jgi:NADH-quinone oxidoreductase subunit G